MYAFPTRDHGKAFKLDAGEEIAKLKRCVANRGEGHGGIGIEVEHKAIGVAQFRQPRSPAMDFNDAELSGGEEALGIFDCNKILMLAIGIGNELDASGHAGELM